MDTFTYSLNQGESKSVQQKVKGIVNAVFEDVESVEVVDDDKLQRLGVDAVIRYANGEYSHLQYKVRFVDYDDVALEFERRGYGFQRPGWINEEKSDVDYLLYMMPGRSLLVNWQSLLQIWSEKGEEWKRINGVKTSWTDGFFEEFESLFTPVPITELERHIDVTTIVESQE